MTPLPTPNPETGADGWIAWAGGECPVDFLSKTRVDVRQRDGSEQMNTFPIACGWFHHGWDDDVLAYRVIGGGK